MLVLFFLIFNFFKWKNSFFFPYIHYFYYSWVFFLTPILIGSLSLESVTASLLRTLLSILAVVRTILILLISNPSSFFSMLLGTVLGALRLSPSCSIFFFLFSSLEKIKYLAISLLYFIFTVFFFLQVFISVVTSSLKSKWQIPSLQQDSSQYSTWSQLCWSLDGFDPFWISSYHYLGSIFPVHFQRLSIILIIILLFVTYHQ